jgi:methylenetetrahydrofolate--tRNA-(uracil-5-)-methyltransferase
MNVAYFQSRYDRGGAEDYLNCPFDKEQYERFHDALTDAETAELQGFEGQVYEGCIPVEIMAKRGRDTLRFGPLKPVGLREPRTGNRPWAVAQLRRENAAGTLYNLVGFQTNLKFPEQKRVFAMIPGLENLEIVRYGVMHRNTFIDSPRLLDRHFRLKSQPRIMFAGQITGVEGYMESAMSGLVAAHSLLRDINLPQETMCGALCNYISDPGIKDFQPMGANMGLLPALAERVKNKQARYEKLAQRALTTIRGLNI